MESKWALRAVAAALAACSAAWAAEPPARHTVDVCMASGVEAVHAWRAKLVASGLFSPIGVNLKWRGPRNCPPNGIQVAFSNSTPANLLPAAIAYALPYEGTRIVVFADRIMQTVEPAKVGYLMGHVLAHEIGHVLEGVSRHSETGVMKARFTREDYRQMAVGSMPFAPLDVTLIRFGLERRLVSEVAVR